MEACALVPEETYRRMGGSLTKRTSLSMPNFGIFGDKLMVAG